MNSESKVSATGKIRKAVETAFMSVMVVSIYNTVKFAAIVIDKDDPRCGRYRFYSVSVLMLFVWMSWLVISRAGNQ
ncbi:MAG: hypothetical protein AB8B87_00685 [Granulosicoccus sp.]